VVYDEDLAAIIGDELTNVKPIFELDTVQVACGDHALPTATVRLRHETRGLLTDADVGNGPVDAVYRAINRIVQVPNELIEYSVQSVTQGIDAMADVTIRLRAEDNIYTGHAAHTDIIVASSKAYIQALNKQLARASGRPIPVLEHV